jgi:hypothetical protein
VAAACSLACQDRRVAARREEAKMEEQRRDYSDYLECEAKTMVEEAEVPEEEPEKE